MPPNALSDFIFNVNGLSQGQPWGGGAQAYYGANPPAPTAGAGGGTFAPSGFIRTMGQPPSSDNLIPEFDPYGLSRRGFDPTGFNAPASPGQPASQTSGWLQSLASMVRQQQQNQAPAPQMQPAVRPAGAQQPLRSPQTMSQKGYGGNSREGIDMQKAMAIASIFAGGAGGMMGGGGAMGGGFGMGGGGGDAGGMMGGMNMMNMMGGGGGGGGGGKQDTRPQMSFAPLPAQTGPLVPQSAAQWQTPQYAMPWAFQG